MICIFLDLSLHTCVQWFQHGARKYACLMNPLDDVENGSKETKDPENSPEEWGQERVKGHSRWKVTTK